MEQGKTVPQLSTKIKHASTTQWGVKEKAPGGDDWIWGKRVGKLGRVFPERGLKKEGGTGGRQTDL